MGEDDRAPGANEIELSLFGPGFGECLLLHLGYGEWLLIDSCIDQQRKEQPALAYLNQIGVDPAQSVKVVVISHWHDDHVRGLAQVASVCSSAKFFCPAALLEKETLSLLRLRSKGLLPEYSGTKEIIEVFETLQDRRKGKTPPIRFVVPTIPLFDQPRGGLGRVRVVALSPSDAVVIQAAQSVASKAYDPEGTAIIAPSPNLCSIVLHVSFPGVSLLLGSDLEETRDPMVGWSAILDLEDRPDARAQVFKVPHHGSANGHHDRVWSEMLTPPIYSALTPFVRLRTPLPTESDIYRISKLSDFAYITSMPRKISAPKRDRVVERQIREVAVLMTQAEPPMGQIRFRRPLDADPTVRWVVDLYGAAQKLTPTG